MLLLRLIGLVTACSPSEPDSAVGKALPTGDDAPSPEALPGAEADVPPAHDTDRLCQLRLDCASPPAYDVKVECSFHVEDADGGVQYDGPATVWIRGRSSSQVAKPGYGVELPEAVNLLGMGGERDWVVDGLYYDRLLVRDQLGYDLAAELGNAAPESALCELERDGEYFGVHALVERIERDDDRVDIADGAQTGGAFVVTQTDHECFYTNTTTYGCWKLVSPGTEALEPAASEAIWSWFWELEAGVSAARPAADLVDLDSAVDAVLIEEWFKNEDAFYTSLHAWKDEGGALHFEPWDLDMTFGQFPYYPGGDYGGYDHWIEYRPAFWAWMAADPAFAAKLSARWTELRAGPFSDLALNAHIDHLQAILGPATERNGTRWPIQDINYGGWFYEVSSYEDEDAHVRTWMAARLAWMDENVGGW